MCGIAGLIDPRRESPHDRLEATAAAMASRLAHRGPDDEGVWADAAIGIGLGFRRLAIVDLSAEGHQPMHSKDGRYTIAFNGEIYNFGALREILGGLGHQFRGHSDTEVLLAAITAWGLVPAIERCTGMFAFALVDHRTGEVSLCRDRLGEKPLYYGWAGRHVVFASELKALRAHPSFDPEIDRGALALYLRYSFVPAPYSIHRHVRKLPAGSILTLGPGVATLPEPTLYWDLFDVARRGTGDRFEGTETEATDELETRLRDAVGQRMHADVPLGAFLSGGIDSSLVVALMQSQSHRPVRTFTVAMGDAGLDEATHARAVARHLGTDHTEVRIEPADALDLIPTLPTRYDEPFADPSQLPTSLICAEARRHVTVCLSGDGGDEVFGGYNRYFFGRMAWRWRGRIPPVARGWLAGAMTTVSPARWDSLWARPQALLPQRFQLRQPGDKLHKLATVLRASDSSGLHMALLTQWDDPASMVLGACEPPTVADQHGRLLVADDLTERMMLLDTAMGLPDDMLVKVDRASMSVGLEARVPLLDHRLVEFAWRLPPAMKVGPEQGKHLLRRVLYRYVPRALVERPKMGFDPPIGSWLRGPLRDWAEPLLSEQRMRDDGLLAPGRVRAAWAEHLSGRRNREYDLWAVLAFQAWLAENQGGR